MYFLPVKVFLRTDFPTGKLSVKFYVINILSTYALLLGVFKHNETVRRLHSFFMTIIFPFQFLATFIFCILYVLGKIVNTEGENIKFSLERHISLILALCLEDFEIFPSKILVIFSQFIISLGLLGYLLSGISFKEIKDSLLLSSNEHNRIILKIVIAFLIGPIIIHRILRLYVSTPKSQFSKNK